MAHAVDLDEHSGGSACYSWRFRGAPYALRASVEGAALPLQPDSEAEFITEHYWGYTRQRDGGSIEYEVQHPPWRVWSATDAEYSSPASDVLYGPGFSEVLRGTPCSAMVAVGSEVTVYSGVRITD